MRNLHDYCGRPFQNMFHSRVGSLTFLLGKWLGFVKRLAVGGTSEGCNKILRLESTLVNVVDRCCAQVC